MRNLPYNQYQYLYPPRPEFKVDVEGIGIYDNGTFIAQPKYNGCACMVFLQDGKLINVMNRHKEELSLVKKEQIDFEGMYSGNGFMVVAGELLNKNKKGEDGTPFNQKFIIWDLIVYNGLYLVGNTTEERLTMLEKLFPCNLMLVRKGGEMELYEHICTTGITGIYRAPTYETGFAELYNEISTIDLYEGLVLKRRDAKLSFGYSSANNSDWQLKVRKGTKNYSF